MARCVRDRDAILEAHDGQFAQGVAGHSDSFGRIVTFRNNAWNLQDPEVHTPPSFGVSVNVYGRRAMLSAFARIS